MRVMFQLLIPGVQDARANFRAEMFGVASDFQERFGAGAEQQAVDHLLVL